MKISYSSWDKFLTCGFMYKIEKILKYEPKQKSSALVFGSAIDEGCNDLLLGKDAEVVKENFIKNIKKLYKTDSYYFFKNDFDYDLLTEKQEQLALGYLKDLDYEGTLDIQTIHKTLFNKIMDNGKDYSVISKSQQLFISCISTMSLKQKGLMVFDAYVKKILPQIKEVISVQSELKTMPGFLDIKAKLLDDEIYILDNKTSSGLYSEDRILNASQLMIYAKDENVDNIGYIVMNKNVKKNTEKTCISCGFNGNGLRHKTCPNEIDSMRCNGDWEVFITPEIEMQILLGKVDKKKQSITFESIKSVEESIKNNIYPMNLNSSGICYS